MESVFVVFYGIFCLLFGVEARRFRVCQLISITCGHTHPISEHASETTRTINTIWRGSVFTGEEPPPHPGDMNHALTRAGGQTQSQLSRPVSSGHHISMEHRLRRKQLNPDTNASNKTHLKEIQEKRKETFFLRKMKKKEKRVQRGTPRDGSKK